MSTNIFQNETGKFLKTHFPIAIRFDDSFKNKYGGFQVTRKPYDFFGATKKGVYFGAEAKKVISVRFPIVNLYEHQRQALAQLEDNKCFAFLFINWRVQRSGATIWITYKEYKIIENAKLLEGRKSLKPDDFDSKWFLERNSGEWTVPKEHHLRKLL